MRKLHLPTVFVVFFCAVIASVSAQSPEKRISLTFLGDIMVHKVNHKISVYSRIYVNVSEIIKNDTLSFDNLEFPIDSPAPILPTLVLMPVRIMRGPQPRPESRSSP